MKIRRRMVGGRRYLRVRMRLERGFLMGWRGSERTRRAVSADIVVCVEELVVAAEVGWDGMGWGKTGVRERRVGLWMSYM